MAHKLQFGRAVEKDKKKTPRTLDRGELRCHFLHLERKTTSVNIPVLSLCSISCSIVASHRG